MKFLLKVKSHISFFLALILLLSAFLIFAAIYFPAKISNLNQRIAQLDQLTRNLTAENTALQKEDTRAALKIYTDMVGKYEAIKEKAANYKTKGVNVDSIEKDLPTVIDQILGKKYSEADKKLTQMDADLEALWKAKQAADAATRAKYVSSTCSTIPTSGYCYLQINTSNGAFMTHVVALDLSRISIVDSATNSDCTDNCPTKPLLSYVKDNGASIGINGTYFCPPDYASCAGKVNSFDMPLYNTNLGKWMNQLSLSWTNRAMIAFTSSGAVFYPQTNSFTGLAGMRGAIANFPGLVNNNQNIVRNYQLTSAQLTKGARGGIGIKGHTVYLVVTSSASVPDLAGIMMAIGTNFALNLDGGGSSSLVYNGSYKVGPGRSLPNAIVFK